MSFAVRFTIYRKLRRIYGGWAGCKSGSPWTGQLRTYHGCAELHECRTFSGGSRQCRGAVGVLLRRIGPDYRGSAGIPERQHVWNSCVRFLRHVLVVVCTAALDSGRRLAQAPTCLRRGNHAFAMGYFHVLYVDRDVSPEPNSVAHIPDALDSVFPAGGRRLGNGRYLAQAWRMGWPALRQPGAVSLLR